MLLLSSLVILIAVGGSFSDEDCYLKELEDCESHVNSIKENGFPKNSEDLIQLCQSAKDLANCLADARDSCGDEDGASRARELASSLESKCQEDDETFKIISRHPRCIKHVFGIIGDKPCRYSLTKEGFSELINPIYEEDKGEDFIRCFERVRESVCLSTIFEYHCGVRAAAAVYDVYKAFDDEKYGNACTSEEYEELEPFIASYKDLIDDEMDLHEKFNGNC